MHTSLGPYSVSLLEQKLSSKLFTPVYIALKNFMKVGHIASKNVKKCPYFMKFLVYLSLSCCLHTLEYFLEGL